MKLLVIGASGFLGGCLMQSRDARFEFAAPDRLACDVTNPASIRSAFAAARPEIVVLTAALADIDRCETEPDLARAINVGGAQNVATECARAGVRLLFTSSGAIFDGSAREYSEFDSPHPLSVYGATKAKAEKIIQDIVPNSLIVRLALVLGHSPHGGTNASLDKLEVAFRKGDPVFAPADEYRNAIDSDTLVRWILDLAYAPGAEGIFNLGASDALSRYEIVCHLAAAMGYPQSLVKVSNDSSPNRAPRGRRHMLVPVRIQEFSTTPVPTCREAVERSVHATV